MNGAVPRPALAEGARDLAFALLGARQERWEHTAGVARRAESLAVTVGHDDTGLLLAAAWLHDIGYADPLLDTGFHPLDGARYLRAEGWPARLCGLVAYHSGARFVAAVLGLSPALSGFPMEESPLSDALTYADQTVGPAGQPMSMGERIADTLARHGADSPNARAHHLRAPYLTAVAARVRRRLGHRNPQTTPA
ncbi:MAG TPA: HD domain-containing protein [Rugosimonospora sp.]|nr:HD domain-containing protein [Rugosimonospora sp.]